MSRKRTKIVASWRRGKRGKRRGGSFVAYSWESIEEREHVGDSGGGMAGPERDGPGGGGDDAVAGCLALAMWLGYRLDWVPDLLSRLLTNWGPGLSGAATAGDDRAVVLAAVRGWGVWPDGGADVPGMD